MIKTALSAGVVVLGFFLLHSIAQAVTYLGDESPTKEQKQMILEVFDCMPKNIDESTLFKLVERDGGQFLSCKRFKTIEQPAAPKQKSDRIVVGMVA